MPDIHLDAAGSNTAPYDTWAKAATTPATAFGAEAAGDRILVGSASVFTTVGALTYNMAGTAANPVQVLSGTKGVTSGITALASGAVIDAPGTITLAGSGYLNGVTFRNTAAGSSSMTFAANAGEVQFFENCSFVATGTGGSTLFQIGSISGSSGGEGLVTLRNCSFRLGAAAQWLSPFGRVLIQGMTWLSGGTAPSRIFEQFGSNRATDLLVEGADLTNVATTTRLFGNMTAGARAIFRDILLPAGWTGGPVNSTDAATGGRVELWNYRVGPSTWNRFWLVDGQCTLTAETTVVRTDGSADDNGRYSVRMVTTANCSLIAPAQSMEFRFPNATVGSSVTLTVQIVRDSVTALTDAEVWLEVEEPDGTITRDSVADVLATPANQASSSIGWTTTGLTNPNKQALSVTINASRAGPLIWRVYCARPSTTLFICAKAVAS
jgi:hypothetical protein